MNSFWSKVMNLPLDSQSKVLSFKAGTFVTGGRMCFKSSPAVSIDPELEMYGNFLWPGKTLLRARIVSSGGRSTGIG
jgi:hypothetical protein